MSAGRSTRTQSQHWGTPAKYADAVRRFFGGAISLDPCTNRHSIIGARTEYSLPRCDGLKESWNFPTIFVNPPYGANRGNGTTIKNWLARCAEAHGSHHSEVLALVPVATNTAHWKQHVFGHATAVCFLYDTRLKFLVDGRDGGKGAPMSCAMIYWGRNYMRFFEEFIPHGAVVNIEPLRSVRKGRLEAGRLWSTSRMQTRGSSPRRRQLAIGP